MATDPAEHELVRRARALAPLIAERAAETERARTPPADLIEALTDTGLFRMNIPVRAGGEAAHPLVVFHAIEALAVGDASVAWVVMIATEVSLTTGWLAPPVLSQMIGGDEAGGTRARIVGSSRLLAHGRRQGSGWRLSGRLNFLSGVEHARFVLVSFRGEADGELRMALLPQRAGEVLRTWDTMGLRGTGSHEWVIEDAYAPAAHTFRPADSPRADGPAWQVPDRSLIAWIANAGHGLGVAQGALDELTEASLTVSSSGDERRLADREPFRIAAAKAQARVSAARAFVREAAAAAWSTVLNGEPDRALLGHWRLANVHAVHESADAVEMLFRAAGTNAFQRRWTLERRFRDMQVARQHGAGLEWNWDAGIRPAFGLEDRRAR